LRDFLPVAVCVERIIEMTDKSFFKRKQKFIYIINTHYSNSLQIEIL
jgi:hypothetical protein